MKVRTSQRLWLVAVVLLGLGCSPAEPGQPETRPDMPRQAQGPYPVTGVVDGDTITVDDTGTGSTVRLLGIDTPETVDPNQPVQCFGPEAAARAEELLNGQQVWLETDPSQATVDAYGRTLAYVWLAGDQLLNLQLIEEGYAREYPHASPYRYQDTFQAAQTEATVAQLGLWAPGARADA